MRYKLFATTFMALAGLNSGLFYDSPDPITLGFCVFTFGMGIVTAIRH